MADDWGEEDFVTPYKVPEAWDGEDVEEEIKDNWDDEEKEEDKTKPPPGSTTAQPVKKKKKKLSEIVAEKEAREAEALERKRREAEEAARALTPEQRLAEKMRLQKIQEDADLKLATELVGAPEEELKLLDNIDLTTTDGLAFFKNSLIAKIRSTDRLEKRPTFITFIEDLVRDLCQNIEAEEVKRVSTVLHSIYNEKVRASKPKSKKKGGSKAKLNVGQGTIADELNPDYDFNPEYDDFI